MFEQSVHGSGLLVAGGLPMRSLSLSVGAVPWSTGCRLKLSVAGVVSEPLQMVAWFVTETDFPGPGVMSPQAYALLRSRMFPFDPTPPLILTELGRVRPA